MSKLKFTQAKELNNNSIKVNSKNILISNRRDILDSEIIDTVLEILPDYIKKRGEGSKAKYISERFPFISISKAKKLSLILEEASKKDLDSIRDNKDTVSSIYNKLLIKKNNIKQLKYVENKENYSVKYDKKGIFYYKNINNKKEVKLFKLPSFLNNNEIKDAIIKAIEENI